MAALTVQHLSVAGTAPTFGTPTTSDTAPVGNGSNTFAVYRNTDTSSHTVTLAYTPGTTSDYGATITNPTFTVAATSGEVWIPLRKSADNGTGSATLTLDAVTGMKVAIVQVP